jgi:hypothetical protein
MNDTLTHMERQDPPPKKGCGCLANTLIGIAVFLVAVVAALWLVIMHTALPLRSVANLIEEDGAESNLRITGVSGSLASGLTFQKVAWDDGEITEMRFRYSGIMDVIRRKQLIIHEMHVGSATLDTTFLADSNEDAETAAADTSAPKGKSTEPPLRLLQIDRVSLNKIIIKNPATGDTVNIPTIEWTGFKAEKGAPLQLGDLFADSDHLVIKTSNPTASAYQKRVEVTLMPKLDAKILQPIRIDAHLGEKDGKAVFDIKAFDETVTFTTGADGRQHLRAAGANLTAFIDAPLPDRLQLDAEVTGPTLTVRAGSFLLGGKSFEIQPTTVSEDQTEGAALLALHREGGTEIRYMIPAGKNPSFIPALTGTPAMSPEDLMALIFHGREYSALAPADREKLRERMEWFSF